MIAKEVLTKNDFRDFYKVQEVIYRNIPFFRSSENDITKLLTKGPSAFHQHALVKSFLILNDGSPAGRFSLIHDQKLPDYVQVSFFEALPGLPDMADLLLNEARLRFPQCERMVVGLNGHLNYGAGILTSNFDEAPVFGLPFNAEYYPGYFRDFKRIPMVSYRFPFAPFDEYYRKTFGHTDFRGISVRKLNKSKLREETEIYTYLNNSCFSDHPFWSERSAREDYELFYPFRFLIREENLLFAEKNGRPIGFFLWYPDFNQLINHHETLGILQVLKYYLMNPVNTFRFTEIAVLPEFKNSHAVQAMILYAIPFIKKSGAQFGEGGFIFEENRNSMVMTRRFLERATGHKMEPYRQYALFETSL